MKKILTKIIVSSVLSGLLTISCCMPTGAFEPAWEISVKQPNGEELIIEENCWPTYDEMGNQTVFFYYTDHYGHVIVKNETTEYYVYAKVENKQLVPGDVIVTDEIMNNYEDMNKIQIQDYFNADENSKYPDDFRDKEMDLIYSQTESPIDLGNKQLFVTGNCTMVPFRAFSDSYIANEKKNYSFAKNYVSDISWNGDTQEITAKIGGEGYGIVRFKVNDNKVYIGNDEHYLAVAPVNIEGTVYVPLGFACRAITKGYNFEKIIKNEKVEIEIW